MRKAWEKEDITKKWAESTWAKKLAAKKLVSCIKQSISLYIFSQHPFTSAENHSERL